MGRRLAAMFASRFDAPAGCARLPRNPRDLRPADGAGPVFDACGIARECQSLVAMLRASHWIRGGSSERIETATIGFAKLLAAHVAPDAVRRIHGLIVRGLVQRRSEDFEAPFEHYQGAGETENAAIQAGHAAEKAGAALAFDRAASFYRHALR
jgi:hypothetical protein